ncbi:CPN21, partial [Symbiodinium pilosum]
LSFSERTLDELTSFLSHAGQKDPACRLQGRWLAPSPNPAFVRRAAIELLAACANDAKTIVDKAWPLLQHPWEEVRIAAVTVLGETASGESGDQAVIAELTKCIQSGSVAMTQAAVTALGKVGKGNEEVISTLRSCLSHADVWVQSSVPGALMCAAGSSALEDLMKLSVHGDPEVAEAAMEALPPGDVGAIAARALDHQDPYIQAVAGKLLLKVHHMPMWTSADACLKLLEDEPKHAPEVPSAEILAAVVAAAQRRELSERKQICIGFLYALGVWQQHQEAIDVLQQLIKEKLWQPLDHAQEALRLMLERPKPKLKKIYKVKWTSSLLEISEGELPYPCRDDEHAKFWNAYRVEGFQAHLGQRDTLETGEGS